MMINSTRSFNTIFIHSLYRSGSTYLFNVFRRSDAGYWCYQEPEHEVLIHLNDDADRLLDFSEETAQSLRHPQLQKPYFWEFFQIKDSLKGMFRKSFSFDDFFSENTRGLDEAQHEYFKTLISQAKGRPVLQFCRSAGRIGALKQAFDGLHIHLWREPRNQWWSFKINYYFDAAIQLIYNADKLPPIMEAIRHECGINEFHDADVAQEFEYAKKHPLSRTANYLAFYGLWLYAFIEAEKYCDLSISIDKLTLDNAYASQILLRLNDFGVADINLNDCAIPQTVFSAEETSFFESIENHAMSLFIKHGYDESLLSEAIEAHRQLLKNFPVDNTILVRDLARARGTALRLLDQHAEAENAFAQAELRIHRTRAEADESQAQISGLTAKIKEAEGTAQLAEVRAQQAEAKAEQVQSKMRLEDAARNELQRQHDAAKEKQFNAQIQQERAKVEEVRAELIQRECLIEDIKQQNSAFEARISTQEINMQAQLQQIYHWQAQASQWHDRVLAIHQSASWKITAPLRGLWRIISGDFSQVVRISRVFKNLAKSVVKPLMVFGASFVINRPFLRQLIARKIQSYPIVRAHLIRFVHKQDLVSDPTEPHSENTLITQALHDDDNDLSYLTPHALKIYIGLRDGMNKNKSKGDS
jgi:hypothetical protein